MNFSNPTSLRFLTGFFAVLGSLVLFSCEKVAEHQQQRFEKEIDISVPVAETGEQLNQKGGEIVISVQANGDILLQNKVIAVDELKKRLKVIAKNFPDQAVIIRGHSDTNFQSIIDVLDEVKAAGIWNVAFATTKP